MAPRKRLENSVRVGLSFHEYRWLISAAFYQHYAAPALAPILVLVTGAYPHLRQARWGGSVLAALIPISAIGLSLLDGGPALLREPAVLRVVLRDRIEETVKEHPGRHLIIVRYSGELGPIEEWVYNVALISTALKWYGIMIWGHQKIAASSSISTTARSGYSNPISIRSGSSPVGTNNLHVLWQPRTYRAPQSCSNNGRIEFLSWGANDVQILRNLANPNVVCSGVSSTKSTVGAG